VTFDAPLTRLATALLLLTLAAGCQNGGASRFIGQAADAGTFSDAGLGRPAGPPIAGIGYGETIAVPSVSFGRNPGRQEMTARFETSDDLVLTPLSSRESGQRIEGFGDPDSRRERSDKGEVVGRYTGRIGGGYRGAEATVPERELTDSGAPDYAILRLRDPLRPRATYLLLADAPPLAGAEREAYIGHYQLVTNENSAAADTPLDGRIVLLVGYDMRQPIMGMALQQPDARPAFFGKRAGQVEFGVVYAPDRRAFVAIDQPVYLDYDARRVSQDYPKAAIYALVLGEGREAIGLFRFYGGARGREAIGAFHAPLIETKNGPQVSERR